VTFFGRPASTFKSLALLGIRYDAILLVLGAARVGQCIDYRVYLEDVIDTRDYARRSDAVHAITQRYTTALEAMIRRHPEQYFWLHRRWKHQPKVTRPIGVVGSSRVTFRVWPGGLMSSARPSAVVFMEEKYGRSTRMPLTNSFCRLGWLEADGPCRVSRADSDGYHRVPLAGITGVHPLAVLVVGVGVAVAGLYLFGTLGINIGYHRLLTHRGFVCPRWLEQAADHFGRLLLAGIADELGGDSPDAPSTFRRIPPIRTPQDQLFLGTWFGFDLRSQNIRPVNL
jgi:hypothetical protein